MLAPAPARHPGLPIGPTVPQRPRVWTHLEMMFQQGNAFRQRRSCDYVAVSEKYGVAATGIEHARN